MKNNFDLKGYMKSNQVGSYQQLNEMWYQDITEALGDFNEAKVITKDELEEMGGVKNIGDKAKMATPNTRPNLGRHRSSDTLDKQVAKDHDKKTVTGDKAKAYKAPHMKEGEADIQQAAKYIIDDIIDFYDIHSMTFDDAKKIVANYSHQGPEAEAIAKEMMKQCGNDSMQEAQDDIFAGSDTADWNGKAERMDWEKDLVGKEVGNWKSDIEQQAGSISWTSEKYPNAIIYATPGWEGVDGIAVEVHESEEGFLDEPKLQKVVAAGTDLWKTKEGYLALMAKIFTTLEKMLTPAEMTEDHGTQINHDMNDDISTDHSEPEHMVQNEDADPFGSIKTGIDKITMGDDDMDMGDDDRMMSLGGDQIKAGIESLMADGFDYREILQFVKDTIAAKRNF